MSVVDDDLAAAFDDLAATGITVAVTVGADTVQGIRRSAEFLEDNGQRITFGDTEREVLVESPVPASFVAHAAGTIDGVAVELRELRPHVESGERWTRIIYVET